MNAHTHIQTRIGIGYHPLIPISNFKRTQTTEFELKPFPFHDGFEIPNQIQFQTQLCASKHNTRERVSPLMAGGTMVGKSGRIPSKLLYLR
jgi:hypothetical protein